MEFSGRLSAFPIGDILQWAQHEQRTGALVVRRTNREKRIYFENGEVVSCYSSSAAEFFGQHLLVHGLIDEVSLVRALTVCQKEGKRLGVVLGELGLLELEPMLAALRRQIQELVCDIFLWQHGVFYFEADLPPREELLPEPLSSVALGMEGARWRDEYSRIRRVFVHDNVEVGPGRGFPGEGLGPLEARIVRAMRDQISIAELYGLVRGSYFRFLAGTLGLAVREILDVKGVGEDPAASSREIHLADLLVEQAAEEEVLFFRSQLAFPLDLLESFHPVWVRELPPEESQRMPARVAAFYDSIDGETPLRTLLAAEPAERGKRMELLALQLRKGSLALLPAPVSTLGEAPPASVAAGAPAAPEDGSPWWRRLWGAQKE
ncbi:MAG TPA: DUF4388 domain-containing protein [Thermoanaerobaculia bacterium]|nr:DUF4388 domain-containing protein [Thermoanaerobaculia bacterium]